MSTYAIGDIQGCLTPLLNLLDKINFDPQQDRLWFTGDLVNRGPNSLETLRFVYELGDKAITVLGNHDLHLLALAHDIEDHKDGDSLQAILEAEDKDDLLDWLRTRPLLHHDADLGYSMIHAGLPPQWDAQLVQQCADELQAMLCGPDYLHFLQHMYGNQPGQWSDDLQGMDRLRFITNCFTRLRYCREDGSLCLKAKGPIGSQPDDCLPWFQVKHRASRDMNILFGHWSTLGPYHEEGIHALDSGCLWGQSLTAMCLENQQIISIPCSEYRAAGQ